MVNRRSILKGAAALGIGGRSVASAAMNAMPVSGLLNAGSGAQCSPPMSETVGPWERTSLTEAAWKALQARMRKAEQRQGIKRQYRMAGLDPDLFERRSGAGWWRAMAQMRRDLATEKRINEMRVKIWPDNELGW